jgi:hypothetical protein
MPRFLIEVPHSPDPLACAQVAEVFLRSGSHFLTNADWGCLDNVHSAWFIADVQNKDEALAIVPPAFRRDARIVGLNRFSIEHIDEIIRRHRERRRWRAS